MPFSITRKNPPGSPVLASWNRAAARDTQTSHDASEAVARSIQNCHGRNRRSATWIVLTTWTPARASPRRVTARRAARFA